MYSLSPIKKECQTAQNHRQIVPEPGHSKHLGILYERDHTSGNPICYRLLNLTSIRFNAFQLDDSTHPSEQTKCG